MSLSSDIRSIPELFGDAIAQLGKLVQNEAQLARAEISQKINQAKLAAGIVQIPCCDELTQESGLSLFGGTTY